jgi:hypothetical protein
LPLGYNVSTLWPTDDFPQGSCPPGNICFPAGDGIAQYDDGICFRACTSNSDCRVNEGYFCRKTFTRGRSTQHTWHNGFCEPIDCLPRPPPAVTMNCPSGFMCERQTRQLGEGLTQDVGVCRPAVDGGPDASPDATADATPDVPADAPADASTEAGLDAAAD